MKNFRKNNKGFTLAEVLVTITIIGIVSALTIPALITKIENSQYKSAYKKMYSDLGQAVLMISAENGGSLKGDINYIDKFAQYLQASRRCEGADLYGSCWNSQGEFYWKDGTVITGWGNERGMVLNNGSFLFFGHKSIDCTSSLLGITSMCALIYIDINGFKKPNSCGKDIHQIYLFENAIKPLGFSDDNIDPLANCNEAGIGSGRGCGYLYLTNEL